MSTFRGRLVDPALSFIAIDYFDDQVHNCDLFLLSHHHCDHMDGILTRKFGSIINESTSKFVYSSPITTHFLRKNRKCCIRDDKFRQLEICKPMVLEHDHVGTHIVVTSLPAAHCVGSVMFLIEYNNKRILYSGDIRLTLEDLYNIRGPITNPDGSVITIDDLYLDTTFVVKTNLVDFPSREKSEQTIIDFIRQYRSEFPNGKVIIDVGARFGYETLFINLCKAFRIPVMFHNHAMVYYEEIEQIRDYITPYSQCENDNWFIHACLNYSTKCEFNRSSTPVKVFKPCALGFVQYSNSDQKTHEKYRVPYIIQPNVTKVFYATHCSLNEIKGIYKFIKPRRVFPSVKGHQSYQEILNLIGVEEEEQNSIEPAISISLPSQNREREEYERQCQRLRDDLNFNIY